jgi:hypothetical protein
MIRFQLGGQWYLMRSRFDEDKDEYNDSYDVYLLPFRSEEEFNSNPYYWRELDKSSHLGHIPINKVGLDLTRRQSIDADAIEEWLSTRKKESGV